jgi:transcription-repair coupling factor (superfamily II helicase)
MRDLEIRGAGNLLGTQQSGHIDLVGYELYCQLLEQAARRLQNLPPKMAVEVDLDLPCEAYIPKSFIPDQRAKIDLYRRLARVTDEEELRDLEVEIQDRFGSPPEPVARMLRLGSIRLAAHRHGINRIHLEDGFIVFSFFNRAKVEALSRLRGNVLRFADKRTAYLPLDGTGILDDAVLDRVEAMLGG